MGFYSNFLSMCNSAGKSPSKVVLEVGLKKSAVTRWKSGGSPTDATIKKLADYFGVPVGFLLEEKEMPAAGESSGLTDGEQELIRLYALLPEDLQRDILAQIKAVLMQRGLLPQQ